MPKARAVPHLPSLRCHPQLPFACGARERGERVRRGLSSEWMNKFTVEAEVKYLSPRLPSCSCTQLPLLGTLPDPACHLA